jgi:Uncharacterized conserved protein
MPSRHIEASAPDGHGNLFVAERDRDAVVRIDARTHAVTASWPTAPCHQPTGLDYDAKSRRIFVGCRSDRPLLAVLNADTGALVASLPIGRGNDGVAFNPATRRIYASNGLDANLMVIDQQGPDSYRLEQAVTTRPMARTLALDPQRDRVYLIAAEGGRQSGHESGYRGGPVLSELLFRPQFHRTDVPKELKQTTEGSRCASPQGVVVDGRERAAAQIARNLMRH